MKKKKTVLIVDDERVFCEIYKEAFLDLNEMADCPYLFSADMTYSAKSCVKLLRENCYDVITLDVVMEEERSGLDASFVIYEELGSKTPVRIFVTGYPKFKECVEAMRYGAWDYIVKEDVDDIGVSKIVVNSAIARLKQLDLRDEQVRVISGDWLPKNLREVQGEYGGQIVALWHLPEVRVIGFGRDAFELEERLREWRNEHKYWEQPMIVSIPKLGGV